MNDVQQKLTLLAELLGDKQVLDGLSKMSAAQEKVSESTSQAGEAAAESGKQVEAQSLAMKDIINVLGIIDPRLASMTRRLFQAGEAFGNIGTKAIDLGGAGKGLLDVVTKLGPAIALLGAGAFAAGGVAFLIKQLQDARAEAEKTRESLERMAKAATERGREQISGVDEIVASRDRRKGVASFNADQARAIRATRAMAEDGRASAIDPLLAEFGGDKNLAGGGEFSLEELDLAERTGFKVDANRTPAQNARRLRRHQNTPEYQRDTAILQSRRAAQSTARREAARDEATTNDPTAGTAELDTVLQLLSSELGADLEAVRKAVLHVMKQEEDLRKRGVLDDVIMDVRRAHLGTLGPAENLAADRALRTLGRPRPAPRAQPQDWHPPMERPAKNIIPGPSPTLAPGQTTIINHHEHNTRNYGAFAAGQRAAISNGETLADGMEMV